MKQERAELVIQTTTHKTSVAVKQNENNDLVELLEQFKEKLTEETRRADGMEELLPQKGLQIVT